MHKLHMDSNWSQYSFSVLSEWCALINLGLWPQKQSAGYWFFSFCLRVMLYQKKKKTLRSHLLNTVSAGLVCEAKKKKNNDHIHKGTNPFTLGLKCHNKEYFPPVHSNFNRTKHCSLWNDHEVESLPFYQKHIHNGEVYWCVLNKHFNKLSWLHWQLSIHH